MWPKILTCLLTILSLLLTDVHMEPDLTCSSMNIWTGAEQTTASPFSINVSSDKYVPSGKLKVSIHGGNYTGLILQARIMDNSTVVGTFSSPPDETKVVECTSPLDTLTSMPNSTNKNEATMYTWEAPATNVGKVEFVATVGTDNDTFWKDVKSVAIGDDDTTAQSNVTTPSPSNTTMGEKGNNTKTDMANNSTGGTAAVQMTTDSVTLAANSSSQTSLAWKPSPDPYSLVIMLGSLIMANLFVNQL